MATRTTTLTNRRNTRNSRNAGETPGIAFGTQVPSRSAPTTTSKRNSDRTVSDNPRGSLNGIPGDDDFGDNGGNDDPDDPDDPDDDGPGDLIKHPDDSDHGDGSQPNPFEGTDSAKLHTSLIRPQTSPSNRDKKQSALRNTGLSAWNSDKRTSDMGNKLGKNGKLTPAERIRRFANNLCLFCGGVGHIAKECPKPSSSAAKARICVAKETSDKSNSTPAPDLTN